ncbi:DHA2 family efflux MFS transporter permease subunit [Paractinoplanes globisporus]|uniref:DHA2 family efflux MFS transporter permease subunit n=1 Tax=Paractinoplanes globisporus TaxID=113565 RepID=A0ABW6WNY3_9ACTN|nr:DHA2 family efflux MFS transporter permease subunit [Actinoplanes globisporus]
MRKWWPLVTVCLGTFMLLIDVTIVNVALPQMATDLSTSFNALQWVVDGYALALGVLLLGAGALSDMHGHRRFYVGGLIVFALASLACGLAAGPALLVTARVVQGAGAAAMFTTTFALLNSSYQGRERGVAYGIWGGVSGAATAVGPVLGGLLTEGLSWRWIFLVNLPICVAAVIMCFTTLRHDGERRPGRFDLWGTLTFTIAAGTLTFAVIRANDEGWSSVKTWGLIAVSAVALAAFVLIEWRTDHAMFDLRLLRNRSFTGILIASLLVNFSAFAAFTYTSIWLQSVTGLSPLRAGLVGLPMSVCAMLASGVAGARLHGRSPRLIIGGGMLLIGVGGLLLALFVGADSTWAALIPGYIVIGLGVGLVMPTLASSAMAAVPTRRGGMAAGSLTTARQLGFAIGVAVLGTVFAARATDHLGSSEAAHAVAGGQAARLAGTVPEAAIRGAAAAGLDAGFLISGVVGLVCALLVFLMVRPTAPAPGEPARESVAA